MAKKVKKIRKYRGSFTCGGGSKKKRRGAGNRGGRGNAGWGKSKWSRLMNEGVEQLQHHNLKPKPKSEKIINLSNIDFMVTRDNLKEIDLSAFKVLGTGKITKPVKVKALKFSASAAEKIQKAGGKIEALKAAEAPPEEAPQKEAPAEEPKKEKAEKPVPKKVA
jgi:large subunit ribosomal protein L15